MEILSIIRNTIRTEAEKEYAFNVLFKNDGSIGRFFKYDDVKHMIDYILDGLRFLSKSRLMSTRFCSYKLKCQYIYRFESKTYPITTIGRNMHWVDEQFWKKITVKELMDSTNLRKTISDLYYSFIPKDQLIDLVVNFAETFIDWEVKRIQTLYNDLGKTKTTIQEYVFPVALELGIENHSRWLCGYIDRIDRLSNDALVVIDYKYGKAKYYSNDPAYVKASINTELGFYQILPQGKDVYVLQPDDTLIPIKEHLGFVPSFYYGAMLFFQDLQQTNFLFPITSLIVTSVRKQIERYWNMINTGDFKPIVRSSCFDTPVDDGKGCEFFWNHCELNPQWLECECINLGDD